MQYQNKQAKLTYVSMQNRNLNLVISGSLQINHLIYEMSKNVE